jgi:hypothetical protein
MLPVSITTQSTNTFIALIFWISPPGIIHSNTASKLPSVDLGSWQSRLGLSVRSYVRNRGENSNMAFRISGEFCRRGDLDMGPADDDFEMCSKKRTRMLRPKEQPASRLRRNRFRTGVPPAAATGAAGKSSSANPRLISYFRHSASAERKTDGRKNFRGRESGAKPYPGSPRKVFSAAPREGFAPWLSPL